MPFETPALYSVIIGADDKIDAAGLLESGLFKGITNTDAPLWVNGQNVIFKDGGPQRILGAVSPISVVSAGVVRGMDALQDEASVQRLFFGDQAKLWMWDGSTVSELGTGYTGNIGGLGVDATIWSFARFGNFMAATNGKDPVQLYKGTGVFADMAGVTFDWAKIILRYQRQLLVFNTSNGKAWFEWSDNDNPEIWTPTSTNAAGNLNIRDMDGDIKAAVTFNNQIAVLAKNQLFLVGYIGAPFYFNFKLALAGIGAINATCAIAAGAYLYGLSPTGFWKTDGVTFVYIDTPAIREYYKSIVDETNVSKISVTYDAANLQIIWSIPLAGGSGEPELNLCFRAQNSSWSIQSAEFARTCWVPQEGVFLFPYGADVAGNIYQHNTGTSADGAAFVAYAESKPLSCYKENVWKYLSSFWVAARRIAGSPIVQIGTLIDSDDTPTYTGSKPLTAKFSKNDFRRSGVFFTVKISSSGDSDDWAVTGFSLRGRYGGQV